MHRKAKGSGFKMKRSPAKGISIQEQIFGTGEVLADEPTTSQSLIEAAGQFITQPEQLDLDYGGEMDIEIPVDFSTKEGEPDPDEEGEVEEVIEETDKEARKEKRKKKWKEIKKKLNDFLKGKDSDGDDDGGGTGEGDAPGGDTPGGTGEGDAPGDGEGGDVPGGGGISAEAEAARQTEIDALNEELAADEKEKRKKGEEKGQKEALEQELPDLMEEEKDDPDDIPGGNKFRSDPWNKISMEPLEAPYRPETTLGMPIQPGTAPGTTEVPDILAKDNPKYNNKVRKIEGIRVLGTRGNYRHENTGFKEFDPGLTWHEQTIDGKYSEGWYYTNKNGNVYEVNDNEVSVGALIMKQQRQEEKYLDQKRLDKEYRKARFNPKQKREFDKANPDYKAPGQRKKERKAAERLRMHGPEAVEQETEATEQTTDYSGQSLNDLSNERDKKVANDENTGEIQKEINKRLEEDPDADWSEKQEKQPEAEETEEPPKRNRRTDRKYKNANTFQKQVMRRKNPDYPWPKK